MIKKGLLMLILVASVGFAQRGKDRNPMLHEVSNKDVVVSVFPEAVKVEKVNDFWYKILNGKNKVIGYAMNSTPYCQDVKGYNDLTPVMIVTDKKYVIKKVAILSNWETARFVAKLDAQNFFDAWNGKKIKDAQKIEVDAHTGATFTASAVIKNVDYLLVNGSKLMPK